MKSEDGVGGDLKRGAESACAFEACPLEPSLPAQSGDQGGAIQVLNEMRAKGLAMNNVVMNAVIHACAVVKDKEGDSVFLGDVRLRGSVLPYRFSGSAVD